MSKCAWPIFLIVFIVFFPCFEIDTLHSGPKRAQTVDYSNKAQKIFHFFKDVNHFVVHQIEESCLFFREKNGHGVCTRIEDKNSRFCAEVQKPFCAHNFLEIFFVQHKFPMRSKMFL